MCLTSWLTTSQLLLSWHKPRYTWEEESPLSEWPTGMSVGHFLSHQLMIEGQAHREQCQTEQVGLGCIRKAAKRARQHKVVRSVPPWFLPQSLPPGYCLGFSTRTEVNPSHSELLLVTITREQPRTSWSLPSSCAYITMPSTITHLGVEVPTAAGNMPVNY